MKPKRLEFVNGIAKESWGEFEVICLPYETDDRKWAATWKIEGEWSTLSYHPTEAEARAACQAEFDRIWAEMTEFETPIVAPPEQPARQNSCPQCGQIGSAIVCGSVNCPIGPRVIVT